MGGFDDHGAIIGDWMHPCPSPTSFFSAMLGEDNALKSVPESKGENSSGSIFPGNGGIPSENAGTSDKPAPASNVNEQTDCSPFPEQRMGQHPGLGERIAARAGFNAPRLNTEGIRPVGFSQNPETRSPCLMIPPGLSPTSLFIDSPVFLANSLVQPSPTTGHFQFAPNGSGKSSMMMSGTSGKNKDNFFESFDNSSFTFKPVAESAPLSHGAVSNDAPSFHARQPFPSVEAPVQSENSFPFQSIESAKISSQNGSRGYLGSDFSMAPAERNSEGANISSEHRQPDSVVVSAEHSPPLDEEQCDDEDQRADEDSNANAPSEDGYNWRKYGQKQVKGSEYPRSYYKCTHPNCPVKKKVERSQEGHITEIIYKGAHNHPKPPSNRRSAIGSSNTLCDLQGDMSEQGVVGDGDTVWTNLQKGNNTGWINDSLEVTSSAPSGSLQVQTGARFESGDVVDISSTFSNDEEDDDRATRGSVSLGYDGEGDESESKRRKVEAYAADVSGATRAIREPRVVVQTTSEVDILDDGYRWRKYGQKVVKGNPNPRSYYKCTNPGCTVRKHVERASHDLKSVITTYEGKHNHDVPAARNNSHVNPSSMPYQAQSNVQNQYQRPDTSQLQNDIARFERSVPLGAYGRPQLGASSHGFGFGMNQPGLANLGMAGLGPNQGKLPVLPTHQYLGQPRQMNEMGFMLPKGEPKMEPMSEAGLNLPSSSSSSVYHQMLSRLPLGHQM